MKSEPQLPTAALLALQDGDVIGAIKIVREHEACDLATARQRVQRAAEQDPALREKIAALQKNSKKKVILFVVIADLILFALFLWWIFGDAQ